jgi:hypothetical protein
MLKNLKGERPVIWIQGGIDESLAATLPYIDVFSFFDDPYRHEGNGSLCQKARVITCQNSFAASRFNNKKTFRQFPPLEVDPKDFSGESPLPLPESFPKKRAGYPGSFFAAGFDFELFYSLVESYPDWGFILAGRTDLEGEEWIKKLAPFPNFHRFTHVPRHQIDRVWKLLDVCLFLYQPELETQHGAFASKAAEALAFGVPSVGNRALKTQDLEKFFTMVDDKESLYKALESTIRNPEKLKAAQDFFLPRINPMRQLGEVAAFLSENPNGSA